MLIKFFIYVYDNSKCGKSAGGTLQDDFSKTFFKVICGIQNI